MATVVKIAKGTISEQKSDGEKGPKSFGQRLKDGVTALRNIKPSDIRNAIRRYKEMCREALDTSPDEWDIRVAVEKGAQIAEQRIEERNQYFEALRITRDVQQPQTTNSYPDEKAQRRFRPLMEPARHQIYGASSVFTFGRKGEFEHAIGTRKGEHKQEPGKAFELREDVLYRPLEMIINKILSPFIPYVTKIKFINPTDEKLLLGKQQTPAQKAMVIIYYSDGRTFTYEDAEINRIYRDHKINVGIYKQDHVPRDPGHFDFSLWEHETDPGIKEQHNNVNNGKLEPKYA